MFESYHSITYRITSWPIDNNWLHINYFKFLFNLRMWRTINWKIFIIFIFLISIRILVSFSNLSISRSYFHRIMYYFFISNLFNWWLVYRVFKSTEILCIVGYWAHRVCQIIVTIINKTVRIIIAPRNSIIMIKMIIHIYNRFSITSSILIRHLLNDVWGNLLVFGLVAVVVVVA